MSDAREHQSQPDSHTLERALDGVDDAFMVFDHDWRFQYLNRAAREWFDRMMNVDAATIIGRSLWDVAPQLLDTRFEREYRGALADGQARAFEAFLEKRGAWYDVRVYPGPDTIALNIRHVTLEKLRQQSLAEASRVLSETLDYTETLRRLASLAVPRVADWCTIDIVNQNGILERIEVCHSDPKKVELARELQQRFPPDPETAASYKVLRTGKGEFIREITDELLEQSLPDPEHLRIIRGLGLRSVMLVPLNAHGRTLGVMTFVSAESGRLYDHGDVAFAEDLAARAAVAAENARLLESANAARAEADRRHDELQKFTGKKARLIRGFAHDVKNPIGAADGHAALLGDGMLGELTDQQQNSINRIRAALASAVDLINDLVELAKAEAGQLQLRHQPVDVRDVVRELLEQYRPAASKAGLELEYQPDDVATVSTDPDRVRQILGNLLSNAVKYTETGRVSVYTCMQRSNNDLHVAVEVRDTGIGIPEDKIDVLFTEFERIDPSVKPGAGLGLAISRRIARLLGGDITVDSRRGEGSSFTLRLPAAPEA